MYFRYTYIHTHIYTLHVLRILKLQHQPSVIEVGGKASPVGKLKEAVVRASAVLFATGNWHFWVTPSLLVPHWPEEIVREHLLKGDPIPMCKEIGVCVSVIAVTRNYQKPRDQAIELNFQVSVSANY